MKEALKKKEVLAMYDVRGIQHYIFKTNNVKEIIGASRLVENIIIEGIRAVIQDNQWEADQFLTDWERDDAAHFLQNENCKMQVMFIGGGNAYVLYRTGEICQMVNRGLAKYVLEKTYSLNLAIAVVEKTENYQQDYQAINEEMRRIKLRMPESKPVGAMPFMSTDSITGYPLSHFDETRGEYLCTESYLKRKQFPKEESAEKILDNMVTMKGDDSSLAVIHIDGNNMGKRIKEIMEQKIAYPEAIQTMRTISRNIKEGFTACFEAAGAYIDQISDSIKKDRPGKLYRKIILAGDDITFICNPKVALGAVEVFLRTTATKKLFEDEMLTEIENRKKYIFSACAGISYFNSHFPFSDAYQVAETCCSSAKARAKSEACRDGGSVDGMIGSFFDYQICTHIKAASLTAYREKNYMLPDTGKLMIQRPYYVSAAELEDITDLNQRNQGYDSSILKENICFFRGIARSQAKKLRNSYGLGFAEVDKYVVFLESRGVVLPMEPGNDSKSCWYDALEMMDLSMETEESRDETDDRVTE